MGFSRQVYWSGVPLPSLKQYVRYLEIKDEHRGQVILTIVATNSLEKRKNSDIWAGPWCTLGKKGVKILESSTLLKHEQWLSGNIKLLNRSGIKAAWENDRKVGRKSALRPDYKMGFFTTELPGKPGWGPKNFCIRHVLHYYWIWFCNPIL